jgi:4'-phosphopantetheinyl transferase
MEDQISIWRIDLRTADGISSLAAPMHGTRSSGSNRDPFHTCRRRFALAQLRIILAASLELSPAELGPLREDGDRVSLPAAGSLRPGLRYCLSRSGDWAWVAVAWGRPVGLDLERLAPELGWRSLLNRVCTDTEAAGVLARPEEARCAAFHRVWARKEALLKAAGTGLCSEQPLPTIETSVQVVRLGAGDGQRTLWLHDLPAPDGYVAALACPHPHPDLVWHDGSAS